MNYMNLTDFVMRMFHVRWLEMQAAANQINYWSQISKQNKHNKINNSGSGKIVNMFMTNKVNHTFLVVSWYFFLTAVIALFLKISYIYFFYVPSSFSFE